MHRKERFRVRVYLRCGYIALSIFFSGAERRIEKSDFPVRFI